MSYTCFLTPFIMYVIFHGIHHSFFNERGTYFTKKFIPINEFENRAILFASSESDFSIDFRKSESFFRCKIRAKMKKCQNAEICTKVTNYGCY